MRWMQITAMMRLPLPPSDLWEVLHKWQCTWIWDNLQWVRGDDWLAVAIAEGTCIAVTDGLYMKDFYPNIQSAMVIFRMH